MRKLSVALLALAAALTLPACTGSPDPAPEPFKPSLEAPVAVPMPAPLEGHFTDAATYPGGVIAEIVSVDIGPAEAPYVEAGEPTWVRVVTRISTVDEDYPVGDWGPQGSLRYGPNRTEAIQYATGGNPDVELITPGHPVDYVEEFALTVPVDAVGELRYSFSPAGGYEEPWVFLDLQDDTGD